MKKKILIVDDEISICDLLKITFVEEGFDVETAYSGREAIRKLESFKPDLLILDVMLPGTSGFDICEKVTREMKIPVIMLTAKSDLADKILGLELGADDYVTKPFHTRELTARVKALLRRSTLSSLKKANTGILKNGNIEIYPERHQVLISERETELASKEFDLLVFFMNNLEQVFTREVLLEKVWGYDFPGDTRTVDVHIQRLRKKIADDSSDKSYITTVFGVGYKMNSFQGRN